MRRVTKVLTGCVAALLATAGLSWFLVWSAAPGGIPQSTAAVVPSASPETAPTPEPTPQISTVRFSATGDNLIHDGIFLQARSRASDGGYDFLPAYEPMRDFYAQFDVNWLNQETLVNDAFEPSGYPLFSTPGDITDALYDIGSPLS